MVAGAWGREVGEEERGRGADRVQGEVGPRGSVGVGEREGEGGVCGAREWARARARGFDQGGQVGRGVGLGGGLGLGLMLRHGGGRSWGRV